MHQGPLQRRSACSRVDVQTGAGKKGGEISLPALTPAAVEELRAARAPARGRRRRARRRRPSRRLPRRELAITALTAGQLGVLLPVLAALGQVVAAGRRGGAGEDGGAAPPALGDRGRAGRRRRCCCAAWLLSILGVGRRVRRLHDRARRGPRCGSGAGSSPRNEATVPVGRVRAVRVVEGLLRRPFGLCALTVEVTGYAERGQRGADAVPAGAGAATCARSWTSSCPSWPTTRARCRARRPARRGATSRPRSCWRCSSPSALWFLVGVFALLALLLARVRLGAAGAPRAGACVTAGWPCARSGSRASPCSPRPGCASRTPGPRTSSSAAPTWPTCR